MKDFFNRTNILYWIGKILIVGVFLYFGIESIFDPGIYTNLVPQILGGAISADIIVMIHGAIEVACALLILFGLGRLVPYTVLLVVFLGVLISVTGAIFVRDFGILGALLLLAHISLKKEFSEK